MTDHTADPIAEPIRELLTVFKEHLSGVSFPDVSYAIIEEYTEKVSSSAAKLEDARKQVEAAEEAFGLSTEELFQKCSKALAYAKVYAEGNDVLLEQLSAIQLGKSGKAAKRGTTSDSPKKDGSAAPQVRQKKSSTVAEKTEEPAAE